MTKLHGHNFQEIHSGVANMENLATEVWLNVLSLRAAYIETLHANKFIKPIFNKCFKMSSFIYASYISDIVYL
jgi:hypothetical protein